ncbi:MAG: oligopeptide ABC transporter permease [Betaproteobacteria bacterium]
MAETKAAIASSPQVRRAVRVDSPLRQVTRRFRKNRLAVLGLIMLLLLSFTALFTPWIARYKPTQIDLFSVQSPPSREHPLGTDELGRDALTRLLYGSRVSLSVGLAATVISTTVGVLVGAVAGYYGGLVDNLLMRFVDIMLSFPTLFLLIILAAYFKTTVLGVIAIIGLTGWMNVARLVRGEFLSLKEKEFTEAARALGIRDGRIIFRHLLPNAMAPVIVAATLNVGGSIIYESALSFLGVGIQPPAASWGNMLTNAQDYLWNAPWLAIWPGFMIFVTVLAFNFVGDGLRDALDPRLKGR